MKHHGLLVAALALLVSAGVSCSDDTDPPLDGGSSDAPAADAPAGDGASDGAGGDLPPGVDKALPTHDKGPGPDGPVVTPDAGKPILPPPPTGAASLRISVDDSTDKAYASGELVLKGAFSFDEKTNVITADSKWSGPYVPLFDDGPTGHEGPGSKAGDGKHGALVYLVPASGGSTIEYGLESPAGWMWPHGTGNKQVSVKPGDKLKDLTGYKLPPRQGVDVVVTVDATKLSGETVHPGYDAVVLRGTSTHWAPLACDDAGKLGDPTKGDKQYTCKLSAQIGKGQRFPHLGLLQPGETLRFKVDIGGNSYKKLAGVSAQLIDAAGVTSSAVKLSSGDLALTVPTTAKPKAAPAPDNSPLPAGKRGDLPGGLYSLPASLGIKGFYQVPQAYDAHHQAPLLVALHGAYEDGQWMVNVWKTLAEDRAMILLAPSSAANSWDLKAVFAGQTPKEDAPLRGTISWLQGRYRVDPGQIGVEGFSDGASMSLYMGTTHGKLFCCVMANSPGGMGKNYPKPDKPAFYITHGDADKVLPVTNARWIKNTLLANSYKVTYVEFPGVGHSFPTDYKVPMLDWFDANAR